MDERRIDLSALDPGRDPVRYERMVRSVLERAAEPPPHPFATALVSRGRLAVAAAVALATAAWIPAFAVRREATGTPAAAAGADPVATVAAWAEAGEIPAGADPYRVLGVNDER
jgi:hypothetical protein